MYISKVLLDSLGVAASDLTQELDCVVGLGELVGKRLVFPLELLDQAALGVVVPGGFVGDEGGLAGVLEGAQVLLQVEVAGVQAG